VKFLNLHLFVCCKRQIRRISFVSGIMWNTPKGLRPDLQVQGETSEANIGRWPEEALHHRVKFGNNWSKAFLKNWIKGHKEGIWVVGILVAYVWMAWLEVGVIGYMDRVSWWNQRLTSAMIQISQKAVAYGASRLLAYTHTQNQEGKRKILYININGKFDQPCLIQCMA
jgi:hypothetical protein